MEHEGVQDGPRGERAMRGAVPHSAFRMHVVEWLAKVSVGSWEGNWSIWVYAGWARGRLFRDLVTCAVKEERVSTTKAGGG